MEDKSVLSYITITCSNRLNTEFKFLILYNSLLLPYQTYAHANTNTYYMYHIHLFH